MDYEQLKLEVKELAEIANSVPPALREKCFEVLLTHLLEKPSTSGGTGDGDQKGNAPSGAGSTELKLPSQVKVFMKRTGVTSEQLNTVVTQEDNEVHFLKEPSHTSIAKGQIGWGLLLALKSGLETNNFVVDPEDVRSICQDKGYYDKANFAANFKKQNNAKLFKGQLEAQGEARALTTDGQTALASLIRTLAAVD